MSFFTYLSFVLKYSIMLISNTDRGKFMKEITRKKIIIFCLPQFAVGLFTTMLNNYLIYFYQPTTASGLPTLITQGYVFAGILTVIGLIKALGHIIDAVSDPLVASVSDKFGHKDGRRIPFMKWFAVHEKGRYKLNCTALAKNAHASLTSAAKATPIERMVSFIYEVHTGNIFIHRLNPQVTAMFEHLAPYCGFPMNMLFCNLWLFGGLLKRVMPKINAQAGGLIGTTCTFNNLEGSTQSKRCTVDVMLRSVDESDMQKDIEAIRAVAKKYDIEVNISEDSEYHAPADMTKPAFAYTMDCIAKEFPQYAASPFILPAGTDARTLTDVCACVLRFAPIRLSAQQLASVHSENENLDLTAVAEAVSFYKRFLKNYK